MPSLLRTIDTHAKTIIRNALGDRSSMHDQTTKPLYIEEDQEKEFHQKIGFLLKEFRKEARISINEMASLLNFEVNQYRLLETGETVLSVMLLTNICNHLHIQPMDLLILVSPKYLGDTNTKGLCIYNIITRLRASSQPVLDGTELLLSLPSRQH